MQLDLRRDYVSIYGYIRDRIADFDQNNHCGPGPSGHEISHVQLGFQFEQLGAFTTVFDTRPKAHNDGEWTMHMNKHNSFARPKWRQAFSSLEHSRCTIIRANGSTLSIPPGYSDSAYRKFSRTLGLLIKYIVIQISEDGLFTRIPISENCSIEIECFEGHFNWPKETTSVTAMLEEHAVLKDLQYDGTYGTVGSKPSNRGPGTKIRKTSKRKKPRN